jgi:hypothetical protein
MMYVLRSCLWFQEQREDAALADMVFKYGSGNWEQKAAEFDKLYSWFRSPDALARRWNKLKEEDFDVVRAEDGDGSDKSYVQANRSEAQGVGGSLHGLTAAATMDGVEELASLAR